MSLVKSFFLYLFLLGTVSGVWGEPLEILIILNEFPHPYRTFFDNQIKGLCLDGHHLTLLSLNGGRGTLSEDLISFDLEEKLYYGALPEKDLPFDIIYITAAYTMTKALDFLDEWNVKGKILLGFHSPVQGYHNNPQIDCFLPCCQFFADDLIDIGVPQEKICVHHCGVNLSRFKDQTDANLKQQRRKVDPTIKIVTASRLTELKGHKYAIRALKPLMQTYRFHYTIIGDGPQLEGLKSLVRELHMNEVVSFLGYQSPEEVARVLRESDIFLHPSARDRNLITEGIPTAIMEAMALHLPVVATWHAGIPELVVDGKTGMLAQEADIKDLTSKLNLLFKDSTCWEDMGNAGRKIVEQSFNETKQNRKLSEKFQELARRES